MLSIRAAMVAFTVLLACTWLPAFGTAVKTELKKTADGWTLMRDGKPYFIKGAAGGASRPLIVESGGNSFRTWGVDDLGQQLDEAQKLGLTVTAGIWLGHERHGFNYNDRAAVQKQFDRAKEAVLKYRDHPALLMWCVGNEMEGYKNGDNPQIWSAVNDIGKMIKELDPNHPTMTTIAEIGGDRVKCIHEQCPDIDVIGINTYAGGPSIAERYRKLGGTKPFVITEFGPGGTWEVAKNSWGAPQELTSTAKADAYRATYEKTILAEKDKLCIGSYVFNWGNKQEATATWYGMFLEDGTHLEALDTMSELWSGKKPDNRCPQIQPLKVEGPDRVDAGATVRVKLDVVDPENDSMTVKWSLHRDLALYETGGDLQEAPPAIEGAVVHGDLKGAELKMPTDGGPYFLYAYVFDGKGHAASAVVPLFVNGPQGKVAMKGKTTQLPLVLYEDGMPMPLPYVWAGWMNHEFLAMDENYTTNPHSGEKCMRLEYKKADGFGGIVWQDPVNDWGDLPGGRDLTGAKKLTFWARGDKGGEVVTFRMGILDKSKKYYDSSLSELPNITLGKEWKQYSIDLEGKDLTCIKTGFVWVVAGQGSPVVFYLDDIKYE